MSVVREAARFEDMSAAGKLRLLQQEDGDIIVQLVVEENNKFQRLGVEFCAPGAGGGQSRHTLRALRGLMDAIDQDNAECVQCRE